MTDNMHTLRAEADRADREAKAAKKALRLELAKQAIAKIQAGERPEKTKRRAMTPARKRRIHDRCGGRCARCQVDVPMFGKGVVYDHGICLWTGAHKDTDRDVQLLCADCDAVKTPGDITDYAKAERRWDKHTEPRKPSMLKGAGFQAARKSQWSRR